MKTRVEFAASDLTDVTVHDNRTDDGRAYVTVGAGVDRYGFFTRDEALAIAVAWARVADEIDARNVEDAA